MVSFVTRRSVLTGTIAAGVAVAAGGGLAYANADEVAGTAQKLPMIGPVSGNKIHVMSYNLHLLKEDDAGKDKWSHRREHVAHLIKQEQPTIVGTQEGIVDSQIKDLATLLPSRYDYVAQGTDGTNAKQSVAIFYDAKRLTKLDEGHRWHSNTPNKPGSKSWGNKGARMMTWVKFKDNITGKTFLHVNTHLDHRSANSREKSAEAMKQWLKDNDWPTAIITGDFNCPYDSKPFRTLTKGGPRNAWHNAMRLTPAYKTHNGGNAKPEKGKMIDWIIGTKDFAFHEVGVNTWNPGDGHTASDHWAVQAVLSLE